MMELAAKYLKIITVTVFHLYEKLRDRVHMLSRARNTKKTKIGTCKGLSKFNNEKTHHLVKITSKISEHFAKGSAWMEMKTMERLNVLSHQESAN